MEVFVNNQVLQFLKKWNRNSHIDYFEKLKFTTKYTVIILYVIIKTFENNDCFKLLYNQVSIKKKKTIAFLRNTNMVNPAYQYSNW